MAKSVGAFKHFGVALLLGVIAYFLISYWVGQSQQRAIQVRMLDKCFTSIQPKNGEVLFVRSTPWMQIEEPVDPRFSELNSFALPVPMAVGSRFKFVDEHFAVFYEVSRIEADGVTIHYDGNGGEPTLIRRSGGSIKLAWK